MMNLTRRVNLVVSVTRMNRTKVLKVRLFALAFHLAYERLDIRPMMMASLPNVRVSIREA